ncbi:hypothetical protein LIER_43504 [Lithospermum erythrorhizon]|uniref:Secreted protein n=1 Tax=Lithospermum erythrorhizon TaxID=34254 RepID=A0AAV3Q9A5_LITER
MGVTRGSFSVWPMLAGAPCSVWGRNYSCLIHCRVDAACSRPWTSRDPDDDVGRVNVEIHSRGLIFVMGDYGSLRTTPIDVVDFGEGPHREGSTLIRVSHLYLVGKGCARTLRVGLRLSCLIRARGSLTFLLRVGRHH